MTTQQKLTYFIFCTDYFVVLDGSNDIVSEAIYFFKANVFFKSYEIKVSFWSLTIGLCKLYVIVFRKSSEHLQPFGAYVAFKMKKI